MSYRPQNRGKAKDDLWDLLINHGFACPPFPPSTIVLFNLGIPQHQRSSTTGILSCQPQIQRQSRGHPLGSSHQSWLRMSKNEIMRQITMMTARRHSRPTRGKRAAETWRLETRPARFNRATSTTRTACDVSSCCRKTSTYVRPSCCSTYRIYRQVRSVRNYVVSFGSKNLHPTLPRTTMMHQP